MLLETAEPPQAPTGVLGESEGATEVISLASHLLSLMHSHPLLQDFVAQLEKLTRSLARSTRPRTGPARVVCVGRTKAGKSTLRYVLTGTGRSGIGRGAQRTTREPIEYSWRGHTMVDSPGVGAHDGAVDAEMAQAAAEDADLILCVLTSDGLQQATLVPLAEILSLEAPAFVLLNHKRVFREDQLQHLTKDRSITEVDRRESRVRDAFNDDSLVVAHVQLDLARRAREEGDSGLSGLSNIEELTTLLDATSQRSLRLRSETQSRQVASRMTAIAEWLDTTDESCVEVVGMCEDLLRAASNMVTASQKDFQDELERSLGVAQHAAETALKVALERARTTEHRDNAQKALEGEVVATLASLRQDLARRVVEAVSAASRKHSLPEPDIKTQDILIGARARNVVQLEGHPRRARNTRLAVRLLPLLSIPINPLAASAASAVLPTVLNSAENEQKVRDESVRHVKGLLMSVVAQNRTQAQAQAEAHFGQWVHSPLVEQEDGQDGLLETARAIEAARIALRKACS